MEWIVANWTLIVTTLFGISEVLALIPGIKSNSVFTLFVNLLKTVAPSKPTELK